jgi:farnesyl diphosphate synthase
MVGGQCLDLEADKLALPSRPGLDHVARLQAMKTGALIRYACEAGAMLGRAGADERRALALYGKRLGAAFQIADDLLDAEGEAAAMGKAARKDVGKATFVSLLGVPEAKVRLVRLQDEATAALEPFAGRAAALREAAAFVAERTS